MKRFQGESGLSWSEVPCRIEAYRRTAWRWTEGKVRPDVEHTMVLLELPEDLGLGYLFTEYGTARR